MASSKLPSGIMLRSPSHSRPAPNGIDFPARRTQAQRTQARPKNTKVTVEMTAPVHRLLQQAASRRSISVGELAAQILGGVLCRGSIDRALACWGDYVSDTRATDWQSKSKLDANAHEEGESLRV